MPRICIRRTTCREPTRPANVSWKLAASVGIHQNVQVKTMQHLPIHVLHQGHATRMSPTASVIRHASAWDDGVRYELTRTDGTTSSTDRTAAALLLRLQVGGSTRLRGTHGLSTVDHQLPHQTCSIFPSGCHLDRVTWEARQSETFFFSVGELSHRDSVLSRPLASIVTPLFGFEDRTLNSLLQVLRNNLVGGEVDGPLFSEGISLAICSHLVHCHSRTSILGLHKASLTQTRLRQVSCFGFWTRKCGSCSKV